MDASGLTGPSLKRPKLKHAPNVQAFTEVAQFGIPGTGMPANWTLTDSECHALYAYISSLKSTGSETVKGDSAAGSLVYARSGCATCHMMNGQGTGIGPELTAISTIRNAAYLHQAITDPGATLPENTDPDNGYGYSMYLPVTIITDEGKTLNALRINEDTYTIQVKDATNNYYSFYKDRLKGIEKHYGRSLMPSYKTRLSDTEIENLIAFLYKTGNQ